MIIFKQETLSWTNDPNTTVKYTVHKDVNLAEVFQEFRRFLLAAGYSPESVNEYIKAE